MAKISRDEIKKKGIIMNIGDKAPDLLGTDQNGNEIHLSQYAGRKLVLYFYPKDNTSGCTAEACSLRDNYEQLKETYEDVKKKYKTTKKTSEKAYHEIRDKIHEHEEHSKTKKENKPETYEEREDDENEKTD